jgi:hypothetical protein
MPCFGAQEADGDRQERVGIRDASSLAGRNIDDQNTSVRGVLVCETNSMTPSGIEEFCTMPLAVGLSGI